jgi:formylglycine-generating enzyme required for sulfatase activity
MHTRTVVHDWDARIDRQRYIGAVSRACFTPGFTFLCFETFECGGQRHDVAIFRNELFAEALGLAEKGEAEWLPASTTDIACEFVLIPEGRFIMGSPPDEDRRWDDEGPQHRVNVSSFLMARTQCTQAVWDGVRRLKDADLEDDRYWRGERLPMENVSWNDIQAFEDATGLRLPSETEWEYACRAGTTTRFCFGDDDDDLDDYGWYGRNSGQRLLPAVTEWDGGKVVGEWECKTHPVGEKLPNAFGLYDMHGNVWEWCEDRWHSDYDGAPTDGSAWTSGSSAVRVRRGGSWLNFAHCRSAFRNWDYPDRDSGIGFRPACSIAGE